MPTYGYRCSKCGTEFDVWQRMSDEPGAACPKCGGDSARLFYPAGIVFKGSGFYKTDSRGSSSSSGSGSSSSGGSTSSDSSGAASSTTTSAGTSTESVPV